MIKINKIKSNNEKTYLVFEGKDFSVKFKFL